MRTRILPLLVFLSVAAAACTPAGESASTTTSQPVASTTSTTAVPSTTTAAPAQQLDPDGFYLMLMFHQHQPLYPLDDSGTVTRPWVRAHAAKDYYDMAALVARYPAVRATFNLSPVLLLQLEALANGTRDLYWVLSETPVEELDDAQKQFIRDRFFDTNRKVIAGFPRYQELLDKRTVGGNFTNADYQDLQLLWNLAWTDPSFLADEPLRSLAAKERDFTPEDVELVLNRHVDIAGRVFDIHRQLWDAGQIEVTTTPLAHPILPLISNSMLAAVGDPTATLPTSAFREATDSNAHVARGLEEAERLLGRRPVGMWPGEGAVAQEVMELFSNHDVDWIATGEHVLAETLDVQLTRDAGGALEQPDILYRPYAAKAPDDSAVAMFFRDVSISDAVAFSYSGEPAEVAVADFMNRLRTAKERMDSAGLKGPKVVSVILDGENAWEHYDNDGIDFLAGLYEALSNADFVETVTPSQLLEAFPDAATPLPDVHPGAWFSPNFATWIGEVEETTAWEYLARARDDLRRAEQDDLPRERLEAAYDMLLFAEGSDWFWWYGSDQDSGDDEYFDAAFRDLLGKMYDVLGIERPAYTAIPIVPAAVIEPDRAPEGVFTVEIDNEISDAEWQSGGRYSLDGEMIRAIEYGFDTANLYIRTQFAAELLGIENAGFDLYVDVPTASPQFGLTSGGQVLGFNGSHRITWRSADPLAVSVAVHSENVSEETETVAAGFDGDEIEFAIPLSSLGPLELGDHVRFRIVDVTTGPETGIYPESPGFMEVPDISSIDVVAAFSDPAGDDHGPGTYTYPTDAVFVPAAFDLTRFRVGLEGDEIVFEFEVNTSIQNPWNSPRSFSVQTFDVYIDTDPGAGTGARMLLDGRNASLETAGWEYAVTLEGWDPALYVAGPDGTIEETKPTFRTMVNGDRGRVIARFDRSLFGTSDPVEWGYAVAILSQEGFPSPGVRRVRDVEAAAQQYRLGGSSGAANESRIIDLLDPEPGAQERILSDLPELTGPASDLAPDQVANVPILLPR